MLSSAKVQNKPRVLQSLTGLTVAEFENLLVSFEPAWEAYVEAHYVNQARQRRYGGGRKSQLKDVQNKLKLTRLIHQSTKWRSMLNLEYQKFGDLKMAK